MLGQELTKFGMVFHSDEVSVVHIHLNEGDTIPPHDHPKQEVFFTVVKGEVEVYLDEEETHLMAPGAVLNFKGERRISAKAKAETEIFVYLVERRA